MSCELIWSKQPAHWLFQYWQVPAPAKIEISCKPRDEVHLSAFKCLSSCYQKDDLEQLLSNVFGWHLPKYRLRYWQIGSERRWRLKAYESILRYIIKIRISSRYITHLSDLCRGSPIAPNHSIRSSKPQTLGMTCEIRRESKNMPSMTSHCRPSTCNFCVSLYCSPQQQIWMILLTMF